MSCCDICEQAAAYRPASAAPPLPRLGSPSRLSVAPECLRVARCSELSRAPRGERRLPPRYSPLTSFPPAPSAVYFVVADTPACNSPARRAKQLLAQGVSPG